MVPTKLEPDPRVAELVTCQKTLQGEPPLMNTTEKDGWPLASTIVPIAYVGWSLWLIALGVFLLL